MLSSELEFCLNQAFRQARTLRHEFLTVEHLLLALLDAPKVHEVLQGCGCDLARLASELNPALSFAQAARIGALMIVLTLGGVILLWARRRLAGSLVLIGLYTILIARGAWIARHTRDRFGALLAIGLVAIVFWQVAINIGMATGLLPVVGITLPLVSYGGSSVIAMMMAMGLLISINIRRYFF